MSEAEQDALIAKIESRRRWRDRYRLLVALGVCAAAAAAVVFLAAA